MNIKFNLESNPSVGFYALYASLRFFKEFKAQSHSESNSVNIASAECYCMLEDLKDQYPKEYAEARDEYNSVYNLSVNDIPVDFQQVTGKSPVLDALQKLTDNHLSTEPKIIPQVKFLELKKSIIKINDSVEVIKEILK